MASGIIPKNISEDIVVKEVTGTANTNYGSLIQSLFTGIPSTDNMKYYIKWGNRIFYPFVANGEFIEMDGASTSFANIVCRVIHTSGKYYEANGTLTLTDYTTNSANGQTFKLVKRAGM